MAVTTEGAGAAEARESSEEEADERETRGRADVSVVISGRDLVMLLMTYAKAGYAHVLAKDGVANTSINTSTNTNTNTNTHTSTNTNTNTHTNTSTNTNTHTNTSTNTNTNTSTSTNTAAALRADEARESGSMLWALDALNSPATLAPLPLPQLLMACHSLSTLGVRLPARLLAALQARVQDLLALQGGQGGLQEHEGHWIATLSWTLAVQLAVADGEIKGKRGDESERGGAEQALPLPVSASPAAVPAPASAKLPSLPAATYAVCLSLLQALVRRMVESNAGVTRFFHSAMHLAALALEVAEKQAAAALPQQHSSPSSGQSSSASGPAARGGDVVDVVDSDAFLCPGSASVMAQWRRKFVAENMSRKSKSQQWLAQELSCLLRTRESRGGPRWTVESEHELSNGYLVDIVLRRVVDDGSLKHHQEKEGGVADGVPKKNQSGAVDVILIEFDGPSHFAHQSQAMLGKTTLKRWLLRASCLYSVLFLS
jgi:hypothetical protein